MRTNHLGAALAALLAITIPATALAAKAHNVVLVHGAFTDSSSWDKVARLLRAKGYRVSVVDLPLTSLQDDTAAARRVLDAQKGPTVLVGHSWGGVVIGEVGNSPKVQSLVYVAAFAPDQGESLQALTGSGPPSEGQKAMRPNDQGFLSVDPAAFAHVFAADLPDEEGAALVKKQKPISAAAFGEKAKVAAWHAKPTYYAISANDLMLPPPAEAMFAQRMKATTVTLPSSHASPVSHPDEVAALIEQAANGR